MPPSGQHSLQAENSKESFALQLQHQSKAQPDDNTPLQLALDIFSSLEPRDQSIEESTQEIGFRKNNLFLEITGLGLTARRAIDVAYFIVSQPNDENELYESHAYRYSVDQKFFKWLMGTSSRNWSHLKSVLREAQGAAIEITSNPVSTEHLLTEGAAQAEPTPHRTSTGKQDGVGVKWGAVPLIGAVAIHSGKVMFEVNPTLAKHIKNPKNYHFLSLRNVFRSLYAKLLYDLLLPYIGNGVTPWLEVDALRKAVGGTAKSYDQYKFFRQHVLVPAVNEVNTLTDLIVETETRNIPHTKKVGHVRFRMKVDAGAVQDSNQRLKDLYLILRNEFGITGKQIDEILAKGSEWPTERIYDAIEYTRNRLRHNKVRHSPGGYLMKAVREGYKLGTAELELEAVKQQQIEKTSAPPHVPDPYAKTTLPLKELEGRQARSKSGLEWFETAQPAAKEELKQKFLISQQIRIAALKDKIPRDQWAQHLEKSGFIREEFGCFIQSFVQKLDSVEEN